MSKYIRDNQLEQYSYQEPEEFRTKSKKIKKFKDSDKDKYQQNQPNKKH